MAADALRNEADKSKSRFRPTRQVREASFWIGLAQQNEYFAELLKYYPDESFYQYCLLQSASRYGIERPKLPAAGNRAGRLEVDLYRTFSGSHAIQTPLQSSTLLTGSTVGDLNQHISSISPPRLRSHDYEELLEQSAAKGRQPQLHEVAKLIPHDQYMLVFNSFAALGDTMDLSTLWGEGVFRLFSQRAQDHRLQEKLEEQLMLHRDAMQELAGAGAVGEIADHRWRSVHA